MGYVCMRDKEVRIRKDRQCYGCLQVMLKGAIMTNWAGIADEGGWYSTYLCETCNKIADSIEKTARREYVEDGWPVGFVQEMMHDHPSLPKTPEEMLALLTLSKKCTECKKINPIERFPDGDDICKDCAEND